MKVKELINFLEGCDPNAEIVAPTYTGANDYFCPVYEIVEFQKGQALGPCGSWIGKNCYRSGDNMAKRNIVYIKFQYS